MVIKEDFDNLLKSKEKNRKKKKYFPDFWIHRNYLENKAYDLAWKYFSDTLTDEEIRMTKIAQCFCVDFWVIRGYSEREAVDKVSELQKRNFNKRKEYFKNDSTYFKNSSPRCKEYWMLQGFSEQKAIEKVSEVQSTFSLEKCIEKYGKEEGYRIWKERQDNWQNTLKSKPQEEIDRINSLKGLSLENAIRLYGKEEGIKKYNFFVDNLGVSLGKFIKRHGEELGTIKYYEFCKNVSKTIDNYIKTFGEELGTIKYYEFCKNVSKKILYSKESIIFFKSFIPEEIMLKSYWGENEWFILGDKSIFFYDFKFKDVIIEYHGHAFHVNPKLSEQEKLIWRHPYTKETYVSSLQKDNLKRELAIKNNFIYFEIYSNDSEQDKYEIKQKILEILNEKNNN